MEIMISSFDLNLPSNLPVNVESGKLHSWIGLSKSEVLQLPLKL